MSVYDDFKTAIKDAEDKRDLLKAAEDKVKSLATLVVASAPSSASASDIINQIGAGVSVDQMVSDDPILTPEKIKSAEADYTKEVQANAEATRKAIALAVTVIAKAAAAGI